MKAFSSGEGGPHSAVDEERKISKDKIVNGCKM